jgi:hypothetical protein
MSATLQEEDTVEAKSDGAYVKVLVRQGWTVDVLDEPVTAKQIKHMLMNGGIDYDILDENLLEIVEVEEVTLYD